jgi:hypothetical protein
MDSVPKAYEVRSASADVISAERGEGSNNEAFERRVPHHPIIGDIGIRDFRIIARVNPTRVPFLDRFRERRCGPRKRLKRAPNCASRLVIPSGPHAACIDQRAPLATRKA